MIYSFSGTLGHNLPIWWDTVAGGPSLRGYLGQQFRGDSQIAGKAEYHFPIVSIGSLDLRGLAFYDASAIWFRSMPAANGVTDPYVARPDGDYRTFNLNYQVQGFDWKRDVHSDVGAGIRFFLRSVAIPLVGFDVGYGLESHRALYLLIVGA